MAKEEIIEFQDVVDSLIEEAVSMDALAGELSFTTPAGWRVSVKVERVENQECINIQGNE